MLLYLKKLNKTKKVYIYIRVKRKVREKINEEERKVRKKGRKKEIEERKIVISENAFKD